MSITKAPFSVKVQDITPDQAKLMLDANSSNRKLAPFIVTRYAKLMLAGEWKHNGTTIKIDTNGELKDGQHRLAAAVQAKFILRHAIIVAGLDPDVFDTIDTGKGRSSADALYADGFQANAKQVAAVANLALRREMDTLHVNSYIEPHRVREWVRTHQVIHQAVNRVRLMGFLGFSPVLGLLWMITHEQDEVKAKEFFDQLETGENLTKGNPALTLRETLLKHKSDRAYHKSDVLNMGLTAWENFVAEKSLPTLRRDMKPKAYAA